MTAAGDELGALLRATVDRLVAIGAADEAIAVYEQPRRVLLVTRAAKMVPLARGWRLGVLLLDRDARLYRAGEVTRAVEPGRITNQSLGAEQRREYKRAAFAAKFAAGEVVNFDVVELPIHPPADDADWEPLAHRDGVVKVRWGRIAGDGGLVDLAAYLTERVDLIESRSTMNDGRTGVS